MELKLLEESIKERPDPNILEYQFLVAFLKVLLKLVPKSRTPPKTPREEVKPPNP